MKKTPLLLSIMLLFSSQIGSAMIAEDRDDGKQRVSINLSDKGINDSNIIETLDKLNQNSKPINGSKEILDAQDDSPKQLDISSNSISRAGLRAAMQHKMFQNLIELNLSNNNLGDLGKKSAFTLTFAPSSRTLQVLKLNGNSIGDKGFKKLTTSKHLTNLHRLELSNTGLTYEAFGYLANGKLSKIQHLDLSHNAFPDLGTEAINSFSFKLTSLVLDFTEMDKVSIQCIANASTLQELSTLSLRGNNLTCEEAQHIGKSQELTKLQELILARNRIGSIGIAALVASKTFSENLQLLDLSDNIMNDNDVSSLVNGANFKKLRSLNLANADECWSLSLCTARITGEGVKKIANSKALSTLTDLNLSGHSINSKGVELLVESSVVKNLLNLDLSYNHVGNKAISAIATSLYLDNMQTLNLEWNRVDKDGAVNFAKAIKGGRYLSKITYVNLKLNRFQNRCNEDGITNLKAAQEAAQENRPNMVIDY